MRSHAITFSAILLAVALPAGAQPSGDAARQCAERATDAAAPCRDGVKIDASDAASQQRLAAAHAASGNYKEAVRAYREALRLSPETPEIHLGLANAYQKLGKKKEAMEVLEQLIARSPEIARAQDQLGWLQLEMGREEEALRSFRAAARADETDPSAFFGAGTALAMLDRHEEALRSFRASARLQVKDALIWGRMAQSALELKRHAEAVSYWERAVVIEPGSFDDRSRERALWQQAIAKVGVQPAAPVAAATATAAPAPQGASVATRSRSFRRGSRANGNGSGFVVATDGFILTNKHVIRGCATVKVRPDGMSAGVDATVVATHPRDDLALLKTSAAVSAVASFRAGSFVRPGDEVVAVGFPLAGLLADQVNVSVGHVNALAGLYNDASELQMSAPVQPGNSGAFLAANGISYKSSPSAAEKSAADVGEIGRGVTVLVECYK
jgi:S1-C subfamily serine protease